MFVKRFFEPSLAQASYLIGCQQTGEAVVIDANRDVEEYIQAAAQEELRIAYVTETHIHADYVSGSRELAQRTGARLCLSDEGDHDWKYQFPHDRKLKNGDRITIGNIVERSVPAFIAQPGALRTNLLGMSFLNRLESWEVREDKLMLRAYP